MPLIHWPNLRFEDQLSGRLTTGRETLRRLTAELSVQCGLAADRGDVVLIEEDGRPGELPECFQDVRFLTKAEIQREVLGESLRADWQLRPWGWSRAAAALVQELKLSQPLPDVEAIRQVNTRTFAADFDVLLEVQGPVKESEVLRGPSITPGGPHFAQLCHTEAEVQAALNEITDRNNGRWVIKANLSHAARNRLLGADRYLTDAQRVWLAGCFSRGEPVSVEPWVVRLGECGLQWTIVEQSGGYGVSFEGAAELLTDAGGQYRGSVIEGAGELLGSPCWWQAAIEHGRSVAESAGALGFRGALGIDCMLIELNGRRFLRPCHDINGRQTMGRLALRLKSRVPDRWYGAWCHISEKLAANSPDFPGGFGDSGVCSESTSPANVGGHACLLQTRLLLSRDRDRVIGEAVRQTGAILPATGLAGEQFVQDETHR